MSSDATRPLVLITGGTRGIGLATAARFAREGYDLSLLYLRQKKAARSAEEELAASGVHIHTHKGNVADRDAVRSWIQAATDGGTRKIQNLIVNAASGSLKPFENLDSRAWEWTMQINHLGAVHCMQEAKSYLAPNAAIVALSSLGSTHAIPDYSFVGASKAALEALVRQVAWEWGRSGIRVNAVSGGAVDTEALKFFPQRDAILAAMRSKSPAPEPVTIAQISEVVYWLCSQSASGIQGQTIVVDSGYSLGLPT